jgi:hypothetical protein
MTVDMWGEEGKTGRRGSQTVSTRVSDSAEMVIRCWSKLTFVTRSDPKRPGAQKGGYADFDVKGIR